MMNDARNTSTSSSSNVYVIFGHHVDGDANDKIRYIVHKMLPREDK